MLNSELEKGKSSFNELFKRFDLNKNGTISREEFLTSLDSLDKQIKLSERQKVLLLTAADRKQTNAIKYDDFISLLKTMDLKDDSENIVEVLKSKLVDDDEINKKNIAVSKAEIINAQLISKQQQLEEETYSNLLIQLNGFHQSKIFFF